MKEVWTISDIKQQLENIRSEAQHIQEIKRMIEHYRAIADMSPGMPQRATASMLDMLQHETETLAEHVILLRAAMQTLTDDRMRQIIDRRYISDQSWEQIAQAMRYDRSYVWRLAQRAYALMGDRLGAPQRA